MSLINDVLKDLERRAASEAPASPRTAHRHRPVPQSRAWRWPLWIITALVIGAILHLSLDGRLLTSPDSTEVLTAQAAPQTVPAPLATAFEPSDQTTARPGGASASDIDAEETTAGSPAGIERSSQSNPDGEPSRRIEDDPVRPEVEEAPASTNNPRKNPEPALPEASAQTQERSPGGTDRSEEATISIRRADGEQLRSDALADAKRLLSRGQFQRAEASLRQLVGEQPGLTEAHELLANTLIQRRQHGAAVRVLESGLPQAGDPAPLAALLGRLLIERGEIARARSVLEQHAPPLPTATDYHLLLAAAHRQTGDHERAAEHYQRLAEHLPRRGAVWIGLGASLESLDRPKEAASAYNRALDGDDDRAVRFARERLAALKPLTGEPQ